MRMDKWGLRKPSSSDTNPLNRKRTEIRARKRTALPSTRTKGKSTQIASTPEPLSVLSAPIVSDDPFDVPAAFDLLLSYWEPKEAPLPCSQHTDFHDWQQRSNSNHGPIIFRLIEAVVPNNEQFILTKAILEDDLLSSREEIEYPHTDWCDAWDNLLQFEDLKQDDDEADSENSSEDWESVKEKLREDPLISKVAGPNFLNCALVVLAERRLRACQENPHRRNGRKYLEILKDFRHATANVDPCFYKSSLAIIELEVTGKDAQAKRKGDDLANEYRHRYLQLVNRRDTRNQRFEDGNTDGVPSPKEDDNERSVSAKLSTAASARNLNPDTSISTESPESQISKPEEIFEILVEKWKTLDWFMCDVKAVILKDGGTVSILESCPIGGRNLFDTIYEKIDPEDRIALVSGILISLSSMQHTSATPPWCLYWWSTVYNLPSWEAFQARLELPRITSHLESIMSTDAAKMFLDSVTFLVGERLLLRTKNRLVALKRRTSMDAKANATFMRLYLEYTTILGEFHSRNMKVDMTWTNYLMNII